MVMIEVEAWRRSRYRSLGFHVKFATQGDLVEELYERTQPSFAALPALHPHLLW
jgi:hypothetical protein